MFGGENVLVAPIKELQRCKAKIDEYRKEGADAPYAACVCDYLRATIFCKSLSEMVTVFDKLCEVCVCCVYAVACMLLCLC